VCQSRIAAAEYERDGERIKMHNARKDSAFKYSSSDETTVSMQSFRAGQDIRNGSKTENRTQQKKKHNMRDTPPKISAALITFHFCLLLRVPLSHPSMPSTHKTSRWNVSLPCFDLPYQCRFLFLSSRCALPANAVAIPSHH
jgi:hypothetical protein